MRFPAKKSLLSPTPRVHADYFLLPGKSVRTDVRYVITKFSGMDNWSSLVSIRQTDVDTLMIRTQSRVRVRVRVIYLNQTGIRHQILGDVGVRVMHSRSDAPSSSPTHSILNCFFP